MWSTFMLKLLLPYTETSLFPVAMHYSCIYRMHVCVVGKLTDDGEQCTQMCRARKNTVL